MGIQRILRVLGYKDYEPEQVQIPLDIINGTLIVFKGYELSIVFIRGLIICAMFPPIALIVSSGDMEFFALSFIPFGLLFIGCLFGLLYRELIGAGIIFSGTGIDIKDLSGEKMSYSWDEVTNFELYASYARKAITHRHTFLWKITFQNKYQLEIKWHHSPQIINLPRNKHYQIIGLYCKVFGNRGFNGF